MNIKQKHEHDKVARGYALELGTHFHSVHSVIGKVLEAKTIDQKLIAMDYLLKTITNGKREDV